ncbi:PHD finger protein 14 [Mortierella sp. AM989]|nr:PHD finger protein 14 [Mortierella sp. AM989]
MVPPQHCPPPFSSEYSDMPMMMMVEHQNQHQQQDSQNHARPGRFTKDLSTHPLQRNQRNQYPHQEHPVALPLLPSPSEYQLVNEADPQPLLTIPGPDIIQLSDDQQFSLTDNSIPSQVNSHLTTQRTRHQSQSLQGQHTLSTRPQRQRRATTGSTPGKGLKSSAANSVVKSPSDPTIAAVTVDTNITKESDQAPISTTAPPAITQLPYTQSDSSSDHPVPDLQYQHQHQRRESADASLPLSATLDSTDSTDVSQIKTANQVTESNPGSKESIQDSQNPEEQQSTAGNDVSPGGKEAPLVNGSTNPVLDHPIISAVIPDGIILESEGQAEFDTVGAGVKRGSRQMSSVSPTTLLAGNTKEVSAMPAKKKAKTEPTKKGDNDTASLFQKIFADRDPGKRKIKTKSVHEIPMDLAADEDDSDFEDTKVDSNDDEDMVIPDDAASEDEVSPDRQEAFNDEQDLLTALWQWKDNDPEVCCVCLGRSTEADNVFVYCDTLDCALCVHQACYGVKTLPSESEPWLCDRCKAPPEEVVSCVCCPSKDGAFRRLIPDDPSGGWVHVVCALWLPETTLGDPDNVDRISVRDIPEKNWSLTCYICSDPQDAAIGACVQCDAGQCRKSFHITCAQGYSLLETIEDSDMADPYFMYCKQHGVADGHPKLNGWAKWVKQRDAFLKKWQEEQGRKRTLKLIEMQQSGYGDEDGGEGIVELFEHTYSRFKYARETRIARERSELSRQYSIGYYLGNKIDKSRSRLEAISSKAEQALLEQRRIEAHTRNLLSSLLECAHYLESVDAEQLEAPLSIDTTLAWYNSLPDTSRWKSNIQDIIETIDIESLACDNPYTHPGSSGAVDSSLDDSEGGQRHGRSSKGIYGKLSKKGSRSAYGAGKNVKSKKVHPKPNLANRNQTSVVFTSSRGRLIKRDFSDPDECYPTGKPYSSNYHSGQSNSNMSAVKPARPIVPCNICHQLRLPDHKLELERDANGVLSPMTIKVLNRMVSCDTCHRQFHPKCLDPPMARVPPRGYSWNCEDCDSSEDSQGSSGGSSPTHASHHHQHQHSQSSDLDEALMVLADTAMTISASNTEYQPVTPARAPKRPHGHDAVAGSYYSGATVVDMNSKFKENKPKKFKTESSDKPKMIKSKAKDAMMDIDTNKPKVKKSTKTKANPGVLSANGPNSVSGQHLSFKPAVAPIIRGNLRIYPPGPHIAPKASGVMMKQVAINEEVVPSDTLKTKTKVSKKMAGAKAVSSTKQQEEADAAIVKKKIKSEMTVKTAGSKSKKLEVATALAKGKAVDPVSRKKASNKDSTPTSPTTATFEKNSKGSKGSKETVRRGSLPAVPLSPPPKPKEVIRYTVGEKTVEELTAKEDVEIERRENVKFRKLRGRTLTMPAPPQEALLNASTLAAEEAAAAAAAGVANGVIKEVTEPIA